MIRQCDKKLPCGLIEPGLFGPLNLDNDAVLHDRQNGPVTESPQGVADAKQGGIRVCCGTLRWEGWSGAGRLAVSGLGAHGFLENLMDWGVLD